MRTVLVGEAPARGYEGQPAFSSRSGQRLSELMGEDVRQTFRCVNLISFWPGEGGGKGAHFPKDLARKNAKKMLGLLSGAAEAGHEIHVLLAGGRVAGAFKLRHWKLFEWETMWNGSTLLLNRTAPWLHQISYAVIPHPSGVNRWWNEPSNVERARRFLVAEAERSKA